MTYLRPVQPVNGRMSSWYAHTRRSPRSSEPGTDYYCPIGTPVVAPTDGIVGMTGDSIVPATGRFVFIKFNDGRSGRALHLRSRSVSNGDHVRRGQVIGYSGATGYGKEDWSGDPNTGGAHVHWTLWPTHTMRFGYDANGKPYTLDHELYIGGSSAGGGSTPFPEEDDMYNDQDRKDAAETLRLLRLVVLAPSGHASPATKAETKYVQIVQGDSENAAEARRMGGVILGAIAPAPGESRPGVNIHDGAT